MKSRQNRTSKFKHLSKTCLFVFIFLIAANTAFCQYPDTLIILNKNSETYFLKRIPAGFVPRSFNVESGYDANILSLDPTKQFMSKQEIFQKNFLPVLSVVNDEDTTRQPLFFSRLVFYKCYFIQNRK